MKSTVSTYIKWQLRSRPSVLLRRMRRKRKLWRLAPNPALGLQLTIPPLHLIHLERRVIKLAAEVDVAIHFPKLPHHGVLKLLVVHVNVPDGAAHAVDAAGIDVSQGWRSQQAGDAGEVGAAEETCAVVQ